MDTPPDSSVKSENQYHDYRTNKIPWFVRLLWVLFWIICAIYVARHLIPDLRVELFQR